jgi:ATP/maltotriose-dependent transcriptional regulator MalT
MDTTSPPAEAEAWLHWFQQHKFLQYRTYVCIRYGLNPQDAESFILEAAYEVWRHWATVRQPCAFLATTLRHLVAHARQRQATEQARLHAYVETQQRDLESQARLMTRVAAVLATVSPRECQVLEGFAHGVDDSTVAAALAITPATVRWVRRQVCRRLQQQNGR